MTKYLLPVAAIVAMSFTSLARAQGVNVAVVNPAKVFNDMQETKDLKQKLDAERTSFDTEVKTRQQKINDLKAQRDLLKTDSPQYADLNKQLLKEAVEFDTWSKLTQAQAQQNQKVQMKSLFDKIVSTTGEIAASKNIDLIIADQRPEIPDNLDMINVDQLRGAINQRNVLFAAQKVDVTNDVITSLDAKYKASGGVSTVPPAPAPGPTPPAPAPTPTPAPTPAPAPNP